MSYLIGVNDPNRKSPDACNWGERISRVIPLFPKRFLLKPELGKEIWYASLSVMIWMLQNAPFDVL